MPNIGWLLLRAESGELERLVTRWDGGGHSLSGRIRIGEVVIVSQINLWMDDATMVSCTNKHLKVFVTLLLLLIYLVSVLVDLHMGCTLNTIVSQVSQVM